MQFAYKKIFLWKNLFLFIFCVQFFDGKCLVFDPKPFGYPIHRTFINKPSFFVWRPAIKFYLIINKIGNKEHYEKGIQIRHPENQKKFFSPYISFISVEMAREEGHAAYLYPLLAVFFCFSAFIVSWVFFFVLANIAF